MAEMARVDASCSTFILVHSSLAMVTIGSKAGFIFNPYYLVLRRFINYHYQLLRMLEPNCSLSLSFCFVWRTALCGSEAQKQKYLPSLAQLTTVGCWVSYSILRHKNVEWQSLFLKRSLFCRHWQSQIMEVMQALWELQRPRLSFWRIWILQESIKEDFQYSLHKATSLLFCFSLFILSLGTPWYKT